MFIGADPYCKVTCEGKSVVTPVRQSTLDPQFDNDMVFYVKKPEDAEIKVQVSCFKICNLLYRWYIYTKIYVTIIQNNFPVSIVMFITIKNYNSLLENMEYSIFDTS